MLLRLLILPILLFALAFSSPALAKRASKQQPVKTLDVPARPTPAQTHEGPVEERIAAVVNDSVISLSDIKNRMALMLLSSGLPENAEVRQHILPQVLRSLIDEQLQLQEGKRLEITISAEDMQSAMTRLANDNRIPGGDMAAFLMAHNVPVSTLKDQVRAMLTWNKVIQRELRPRIDIGDDEIDAAIERISANAGKQEFLVSEVFLPVDNPGDEDQVRQFAQNLVQQIKSGANFGAIARQFSRGTGASTGGDIGWIQSGQLGPELDKVLQTLQAGEIAGPVRSANGFHILGVREKRTVALGDPDSVTMNLQQAFRPFSDDLSKEDLLKEADRLRQTIGDCKELKTKLEKDFPAWRWQDLGNVKVADTPIWLANKVQDISAGHATDAMATDKGALIVFVCSRSMPSNINRNEIMQTIGMERLELLARRLLRDLRRNAHIDVRLSQS